MTQDSDMLIFFGKTLEDELKFCSRIAMIHSTSKDSIKAWREMSNGPFALVGLVLLC